MSAIDIPETPKTVNEAFENNTVVAVRTLEQQLRASASRDKERLRILVGGNYRELLSTAEHIVALDRSTKQTEVQISNLSRQCHPPQQLGTQRTIASPTATSAQLRLLIQCINHASLAVKARWVLQSAELIVISRLLLKSVEGQQNPPKLIEKLKTRASALRTRLLQLIDTQLAHPASSIEVLVHAICAYCLVTSASSGDAVSHFRDVRLEKLRQRMNDDANDQTRIFECFQYLVISIQLLKTLLGRAVNDVLSSLQKQPILQNQSISKLEVLDTGRLQNLIPHDILVFTPYIKRVLLKQDEIQQILAGWSEQACDIFVKGLKAVLATMKSVRDVLTLRKKLCSIVLPVYFSTHGQDLILRAVRQATNTRVLEMCHTQVESLLQVGQTIVSSQVTDRAGSSLWDPMLVQRSLDSNSANYVRQVQAYHLGTKEELSRPIRKIRSWSKQVMQLRAQFQALESVRWRDMLEEPDDEDEEAAQDVVLQLSKKDPDEFRNAMEASLQSTVSEFNEIMHKSAVDVCSIQDDAAHADNSTRIVHLLRAYRECSIILNKSVDGVAIDVKASTLKLHQALAKCVTDKVTTKLKQEDTVKTPTFDLPEDLPSPQTFKLLRETCKIMADVGGADIWSTTAVSILKKELREELLDEEKRPACLRGEFDYEFVAAALSGDDLSKKSEAGTTRSKARGYWLRTRLLFGVLG